MIAIYLLVDPRNGRVMYVGQSANPEKRAVNHRCRSERNAAKQPWLADLRRYDMRPKMIVLDWVNECDALDVEREVIRFHAEIGSPLFNLTGRNDLPVGARRGNGPRSAPVAKRASTKERHAGFYPRGTKEALRLLMPHLSASHAIAALIAEWMSEQAPGIAASKRKP